MRRSGILANLAALLLIAIAPRISGAQEKVLYSFGDTAADGRIPQATLTRDSKGNLYGTTWEGGAYDAGTVFELLPLSGGGWKEEVLHSFGAPGTTDGENPAFVTPVFDAKGNLYGTTEQGGTNETGTVFEMSPEANGSWTEKVIYNFGPYSVGSVSGPTGGVVFDVKGNLYGSTKVGYGAVFELSPVPEGQWTAKILYTGLPSNIGERLTTSLIFDTKGNLFGASGGVFELSPTASGPWTFTSLASFAAEQGALGALAFDSEGNLYGATTGGGGPYSDGAVFELSPETGGKWTQKVLFDNFGPTSLAGAIGSNPEGGVSFDSAGNLYGTTQNGGSENLGTVFELSPAAGGGWTGKILHSFGTITNDGAYPTAGVTFDAAGNLFGTTPSGGAYGATQIAGTVYEIASKTVATPYFSPLPGPYLAKQGVTIADATPGVTIYYTTGGDTPTTSSPKYIGPIEVAESLTIKAIAVASGLTGAQATATYEIGETAAAPLISPSPGAYDAVQSVSITGETPGSAIYYTTNGNTPTTASTKYTAPFPLYTTETIKAIAVASGYYQSAVTEASFKLPGEAPYYSNGILTTVGGVPGSSGNSGDKGPFAKALLNTPGYVFVDSKNNLYVVDYWNHDVRKVTAGTITLLAGNGKGGYLGDKGKATAAELLNPSGGVADSEGNVYIADTGNNVIRKVTAATGNITTVAGHCVVVKGACEAGFGGDEEAATSAFLSSPNGVAVDSAGNLYIADTNNQVVRKVNFTTQTISTVAGIPGQAGWSGDGGLATAAKLLFPSALVLDASGDLYITSGNAVRRVDGKTGKISTVAGDCSTSAGGCASGYSGDGGPAVKATLNFPHEIALDAAGNLYIADTFNYVIRQVNFKTGVISTAAGNGKGAPASDWTPNSWDRGQFYGGDGGPAILGILNDPTGVAIDASGNLLIGDNQNALVREVVPASAP